MFRSNPSAYQKSINNDQERLFKLVQRTVNTVSGKQNTPPFRYLDLPPEIRFQILAYSDLISSSGGRYWRPRYSKPVPCPLSCECRSVSKSRWWFCDWDHLDHCLDFSISCLDCCHGCKTLSSLCYCNHSHDVTFLSSCLCTFQRHPLLQVSRQVREDAIPVYYSQHRFIVAPFGSLKEEIFWDWTPSCLEMPSQIELSIYVSSITRNALQHMRWLE